MYLILNIIAASSFLIIIRDRDASFSYLANIKAFSVVFPAFRLILVKAIDRFSAVFSASARFLVWRSICYSNFWYWELLQIGNS
jgi:hypothetical protein